MRLAVSRPCADADAVLVGGEVLGVLGVESRFIEAERAARDVESSVVAQDATEVAGCPCRVFVDECFGDEEVGADGDGRHHEVGVLEAFQAEGVVDFRLAVGLEDHHFGVPQVHAEAQYAGILERLVQVRVGVRALEGIEGDGRFVAEELNVAQPLVLCGVAVEHEEAVGGPFAGLHGQLGEVGDFRFAVAQFEDDSVAHIAVLGDEHVHVSGCGERVFHGLPVPRVLPVPVVVHLVRLVGSRERGVHRDAFGHGVGFATLHEVDDPAVETGVSFGCESEGVHTVDVSEVVAVVALVFIASAQDDGAEGQQSE